MAAGEVSRVGAVLDAGGLDARTAIMQLRDAQGEVLVIRARLQSVAERLARLQEGVIWSGAAADAWRGTVSDLVQASARGVEALDELHRLVGVAIARIEEGMPS